MTIGSTLRLTFLPLWVRVLLVCVFLLTSMVLYLAMWLGLFGAVLSLMRFMLRRAKGLAIRGFHSFLTLFGFHVAEQPSENERTTQQSAGEERFEERTQDARRRQQENEDPYSILGVSAGASRQTIQTAYREQMKLYHPDRVQHLGEALRRVAHEQSIKIQNAYDALYRGKKYARG